MLAVGIRDLKNNLSRYLRRVRLGERVLVTDRGRVIAELRPPENADPPLSRYEQLKRDGLILPAKRKGDPLRDWPDIRLPPGTAAALIDEDRDETRRP